MPLLILVIGHAEWAQVALGQSVGLVGAVLVSLGWDVTGPSQIAESTPRTQYAILVRSLWARLILTVPVSACMFVVAVILPNAWNPLFLWTSVASTLLGLASGWFYLGLDRPIALFVFDALARGLGTIAGLVLTLFAHNGIFYSGGMAAGVGVSIFGTILYARRRAASTAGEVRLGAIFEAIGRQGAGLGFNVSYVVLSSLALPLSSFMGSHVFLTFTTIDKIQKQLVTVMLPVLQIVVGRMSRNISDGKSAHEAAIKSMYYIGASAVLIFMISIVVSPPIVDFLSLGTVSMDLATDVAFAVLVSLAFTTQIIPFAVLAPLKRLRFSSLGNVAAILTMTSLFLLGGQFSITGIVVSVDLAFGVCLAFLLVGVRDLRRVEVRKESLV
jgi:O-antigen/teichoic acid export membrane protein